jgi:hypothetical protein
MAVRAITLLCAVVKREARRDGGEKRDPGSSDADADMTSVTKTK